MTATQPATDVEQLAHLARAVEQLRGQVARRIVGQQEAVDGILTAILAGGHALLIGVPGLAKTLMVSTVAEALHLSFNRVQFTPDLMPSDITGTEIIEEDLSSGKRVFRFVQGPIFANVVLADEINRASPKTQSALLEAMEEGSVTVDGQTRLLPQPFGVVATQNPVEHEGTYTLPHAELDRFMIKMDLGYPDDHAETEMLKLSRDPVADLSPVVGVEEFLRMRQLVEEVHASEAVLRYVVSVTSATRDHRDVYLGASPRASRMLLAASRAWAAASGRSYCTPDDVKALAPAVLAHRIIASTEARGSSNGFAGGGSSVANEVVREILRSVPVTEAV